MDRSISARNRSGPSLHIPERAHSKISSSRLRYFPLPILEKDLGVTETNVPPLYPKGQKHSGEHRQSPRAVRRLIRVSSSRVPKEASIRSERVAWEEMEFRIFLDVQHGVRLLSGLKSENKSTVQAVERATWCPESNSKGAEQPPEERFSPCQLTGKRYTIPTVRTCPSCGSLSRKYFTI